MRRIGAGIDAAGNLQTLRIKFTAASNAVDFTVQGQMQPTLDINGTIGTTTALFNGVPINGLGGDALAAVSRLARDSAARILSSRTRASRPA